MVTLHKHGIGMIDFSGFGRAMHPNMPPGCVAAEFDEIVDGLWDDGRSEVAAGVLPGREGRWITSQSGFSVDIVDGELPRKARCRFLCLTIARLRKTMQTAAATDLRTYRLQPRTKQSWHWRMCTKRSRARQKPVSW
jgi:hypothetical protein